MPAEPAEAWADVSVIVPAYRAAGTIGRALAGVAAQTVRPRQVIVVDDGSDDGTLAATEACRQTLGEIDLIALQQPNRGAGAARNRAVGAVASNVTVLVASPSDRLAATARSTRSIRSRSRGRMRTSLFCWRATNSRSSTMRAV